MVPRDPIATVRDAVHRAAGSRRAERQPADPPGGAPTDPARPAGRDDEHCEELEALREAEARAGVDADRADLATATAAAYLAARRRRLKRQLDAPQR